MSFVTLNQCPPGVFRTEVGTYGFKSEYATKVSDGYKCDAYCLESGEYFQGGVEGTEARGELLVEPVNFLDELDKLRMQHKHLAADLDETKAAHDRTRDRLREAEAAKRDSDNQRRFFESRATEAERRLEQAQGVAMELRGRLLEIRDNRMVRRGDLVPPQGLPDPYDDGIPF
ncbi:hypothetical protein NUH86_10800 [Sphingobium sp. JS3065]|uniref:hypothetical protein n=1 Tax=Sphingobium sp. JS3065 TaxID=2970925 RepID=UPI002264DC04|nr:hypothetical protein [Sphingobium sp. JS3065]UZW54023.1 hypothetical protein NUH86_10800 [Sphingobium sp. JS3065]